MKKILINIALLLLIKVSIFCQPAGWEWAFDLPVGTKFFSDFSEGLADVEINGKYGFINKSGNLVIKPKYVLVGTFQNGYCTFVMGDKIGFIDKTGREVIPANFEYNKNNITRNNLFTGFHDGVCRIFDGGNVKFIDTNGSTVLELPFGNENGINELGGFNDGLAIVCKGKNKGFIDKNGKFVVSPNFNDINGFFAEGLACVSKLKRMDNGADMPNYGYIDKNGNTKINLQYNHAEAFSEGLAIVKKEYNGRYGYIDKNGNTKIAFDFLEAESFSEGLAAVSIQKGLYGFIDKKGKMVIEAKFPYLSTDNSFKEGFAKVYDIKSGHWGLIDKKGNYVLSPAESSKLVEFKEGFTRHEEKGRIGYIRLKGTNLQMNPTYDTNNLPSLSPKVWAVIVGISDYPGFSDDLRFCDDDAKSVYNFLKSPQGGQVPESQIKLLVDADATYNTITYWAESLYSKANENDLLLFYFSGHGTVGNFYVNGNLASRGEFLPHSTLRNILGSSKSKKKICVADACHSGSWEKAKKELAVSGKALSNEDMIRLYYSSLSSSLKLY